MWVISFLLHFTYWFDFWLFVGSKCYRVFKNYWCPGWERKSDSLGWVEKSDFYLSILILQTSVNKIFIIRTMCLMRSLSLTGRYLTMLPMEPKLGKMLILGAIFNCLDPVLTIVAGLSVRDPFLTPFDKKDVSWLFVGKSWDMLIHMIPFFL